MDATEPTRPSPSSPPHPETPEAPVGPKGYSVNEFARMLRLSRSTIRHYEQLGILDEGDLDETGRRYSPRAREHLYNALILNNIGIPPREIAEMPDDDYLSLERIEDYQAMLARKRRYLDAQAEGLERHAELMRRANEVWMEDVEPYLFLPVTSDPHDGNDLTAAPSHVPISSIGILFEGPDWEHPDTVRTGRSIARRHAHLVEGFHDGLEVLGGCTCLRTVHQGTLETLLDEEGERPAFDRLHDELGCRRLQAVGPVFSTCGVTTAGRGYIGLYLPVKRRGLGHALLHRH